MIKYFSLIIIATLSFDFQNDQGNSEFFSYKGIEGVIFRDSFPPNFRSTEQRWTPTLNEVIYADGLVLKKNYKKFGGKCNDSMLNDAPVIANNWNNYFRQVIGIKNKRGDRIVLLNYIWKPDTIKYPNWKSQYVNALGGYTYQWEVKVNLNKKKVFDLLIF